MKSIVKRSIASRNCWISCFLCWILPSCPKPSLWAVHCASVTCVGCVRISKPNVLMLRNLACGIRIRQISQTLTKADIGHIWKTFYTVASVCELPISKPNELTLRKAARADVVRQISWDTMSRLDSVGNHLWKTILDQMFCQLRDSLTKPSYRSAVKVIQEKLWGSNLFSIICISLTFAEKFP